MTNVEQRAALSMPPVPETRRDVVTDILHGVEIQDPYRWLEDGDSPETKAWVAQQNARTAAILGSIPGRDRLARRLDTLSRIGTVTSPKIRNGRYFYLRRSGEMNQPVLCLRDGIEGEERILVDPNAMSAAGLTALDWWEPSPDGSLVVFGTSRDGNEWSTLQIVETATGALKDDRIERTRYSSIAWLPDSSAFFYTRYPEPGTVPPGDENYNSHVFFHLIGEDPARDTKVFGEGRTRENQNRVSVSDDGRWIIVVSYTGWARSDVFVRDRTIVDGPFIPLVTGRDAIYTDPNVIAGRLYLLTNDGAPNYKVVSVDLDSAVESGAHNDPTTWPTAIAERADRVLEDIAYAKEHIAVATLSRAVSGIEIYGLDGTPRGALELPALGTVESLDADSDADEIAFTFTTFAMPSSAFVEHLTTGERRPLAPEPLPSDVNLDRFQIEQVSYASKDGTEITMFLVGTPEVLAARDGDTPTILEGYGGFNISRTSSFRWPPIAWLELGMLLAIPNLRGGGEYGEAWHRAGMLGNKQNVFDDYIAAARWLIDRKYTRPERLAVRGRSNGGLLTGTFLTQAPDLCAAVSCGVPLLDMVRYHKFSIARLWIPEYGSSDDPEQVRWLYAYSPYHHVEPGRRYPAVLFYTAEEDTRVDPLHARKMTALLQAEAANGKSDDRPILLRVETQAGHGAGKPRTKVIEEALDETTFLAWQLGVAL